MFRRRPRETGEPHGLIERVERAKADLVTAVPSPRGVPGRPVADALAAFEEGLREVVADPDVPEGWRPAIAESLSRAERFRLKAPPLDYEGLVGSLADLLAPLDALDA